MKKNLRIPALVMAMVMLMSSMAFATPAAVSLSKELLLKDSAKKEAANIVSIVSPANNSISTSDSLLVSVKLTQPATVRITVYEEFTKSISPAAVISTQGALNTQAAITASPAAVVSSSAVAASPAAVVSSPAVAASPAAVVSSPAVTATSFAAVATASAATNTSLSGTSVIYSHIDTTSFEAVDFVSNPALAGYVDLQFEEPVTYVSRENIGFYTKQLSVKPGIYKVVVEVIEEDGRISETTRSLVAVKEKPAEEEAPVFEQKQSGAIKLLQNILKSLFK